MKRVTWPIGGWSVIRRLALDIFHMHIKFGKSRFKRSWDAIAGVETKNGSCDPHHAFCHPKAVGFGTVYLYAKFDDSSCRRLRDIIGGLKTKVGHVTLTTRMICHSYAGTWHSLPVYKIIKIWRLVNSRCAAYSPGEGLWIDSTGKNGNQGDHLVVSFRHL